MADNFPKKILPMLEGPSGELRMVRFWAKVDMRRTDECWPWKASVNPYGYGRFKIASYETTTASRVALIASTRQEPDGMQVLHRCDNPRCCNPNHLYFGTHEQNMRDKIERNRCRSGDQRGAKNGAAKLDDAQLALVVRRLQSGWSNTSIAEDLPIGHAMVSKIRLGHLWREQTAALGYEPKPHPNMAKHLARPSPSILAEIDRLVK